MIEQAKFTRTTDKGFSREQLYSTASYQQHTLRGIYLIDNDLTDWDFGGQDLAGAILESSVLSHADLSSANLANSSLAGCTLSYANLAGAHLKNATLLSAIDATLAIYSVETVYNQWTKFPDDFDPAEFGITLEFSPAGDFDGNDLLDISDLNLLTAKMLRTNAPPGWQKAMFDVNADGDIDGQDHEIWVHDLKNTYYGDADLNGQFDSRDMVQVFAAGKYEQGWLTDGIYVHGETAGWSEGDWNADRVFDSGDFVTAFADGGYEQGPRIGVTVVPEPGAWAMLVVGLALALFGLRCWRVD